MSARGQGIDTTTLQVSKARLYLLTNNAVLLDYLLDAAFWSVTLGHPVAIFFCYTVQPVP